MIIERGSFIDRVDRNLRREDTMRARIARKLAPTGHEYLDSWQKRWLVDIPMGIAGGVFTAPLTAALCAAVWLEDKGPIFYKHERMGKDGKKIHVWKIRSMRLDADKYSPEEVERINIELGVADDPRNTRIGRILRRFELDELPQFWQVVRGDFSLCGIRVMHPAYRDSMAKSVNTQDMVLWDAAYNRGRGAFNPNASRIRHRKDDKKRIHDDLIYDRKASLGLDYYLLIITALKMFALVKWWLDDRAYAPLKNVVVRDIGMQIAPQSRQEWSFAKHFLRELTLERELIEIMRSQGESGRFLDIGASIGLYSSLALRCGMDVTAVEPDRQSVNHLAANTKLNQQRDGQLQVIGTALTDHTGVDILYSDGFLKGCPSLRRTLNQQSTHEVPVTSLDELIESGAIQRPTLIKIDVEGAEMHVLRGGSRYFSRDDAADIFIEVHPDFLPLFDSNDSEVIRVIRQEFGYKRVSSIHKQGELMLHFSKSQ